MFDFQSFIGGIFETNAYLIQAPGGDILIDAPTGSYDWLRKTGKSPALLMITHGHIDHVDDAARIKRAFGCRVVYHRDTEPLITDPDFFKRLGFFFEVEPVKADELIDESAVRDFFGIPFQVMLVPGHCPGSLCFYSADQKTLFSGDTLFAGSIGRTDLPGGNHRELIGNIRSKILPLPDDTLVYPGHGPSTTIGDERRSNPFLE